MGGKYLLRSDCKDCGHSVYHPPLDKMAKRFENVHIKIYYDYPTKHYVNVVKGQIEKIFTSCSSSTEQLQTDKEIGKVLAWTNGDEEN